MFNFLKQLLSVRRNKSFVYVGQAEGSNVVSTKEALAANSTPDGHFFASEVPRPGRTRLDDILKAKE